MTSGHERPVGDACPICLDLIEFPMGEHAKMNFCCMKMVCNGCIFAAFAARQQENVASCEFCRTTLPADDTYHLAMIQKRVDKGDAAAIFYLGCKYHYGQLGLARMFPERSSCGRRPQSLDQMMHMPNLASCTTLAMASQKTSQGAFTTGSRPQ